MFWLFLGEVLTSRAWSRPTDRHLFDDFLAGKYTNGHDETIQCVREILEGTVLDLKSLTHAHNDPKRANPSLFTQHEHTREHTLTCTDEQKNNK